MVKNAFGAPCGGPSAEIFTVFIVQTYGHPKAWFWRPGPTDANHTAGMNLSLNTLDFFMIASMGYIGKISPTRPVLYTCAMWHKTRPRPDAPNELQNGVGSLRPTKFLDSGTPPT